MENRICLNCSHEITKNFCANCGQKTDTHRITFKHFIAHDVLHGIWHIERGILFTLKETLLRPGQAALDYIGGKRIRYYNIFYLCLLVIGVHLLLTHLYDTIHPERLKADPEDEKVVGFLAHYLKIILLAVVPVIAVDAKFIFRRLKLNLAEHFIISGINLLGMLLMAILFLLFNFVNEFDMPVVFGWLEVVSFALILLYPTWTYGNAIKREYSFLGKLWRILAFNIVIFVQVFLALLLIFWIINKNSELIIKL